MKTSNIYNKNYSESAALQELLKAKKIAADAMFEAFDNDEDYDEQFTINIGGKSIAFMLGGTQMQALNEFVKSIADENFYEVDFEECTVEE